MLGEKDSHIGYFILILIGILLTVGVYVFFTEPATGVEDNYQYSNGESVFNVTKVSETETYITLYVGVEEYPYAIALRNDPLSLEDIPVEGTVHTRIYGDEGIYVTVNPLANLSSKVTVAALEIDKIIDNEYLYNIPVLSAMTLENEDGFPVVSCYDATDAVTVILLTLGSETIVYTDEYCIVIVGTTEDEIIRAADRFLYELLGIMQ